MTSLARLVSAADPVNHTQCFCCSAHGICLLTASVYLAAASNSKPARVGLTITTARKSVTGTGMHREIKTTSRQVPQNLSLKTSITVTQQGGTQNPSPADQDHELTTVSSVSVHAIPGLRKQASVIDPAQTKQLEKGWGLSYKDANAPVAVRKEVYTRILCLLLISTSCFCQACNHLSLLHNVDTCPVTIACITGLLTMCST